MKKTLTMIVLAVALMALFAGAALAAGPSTPPGPGLGRGMGIHTPGTGMAQPDGGQPGARGGGMMGRGAPAWAGQPEEVTDLLGMTSEEIQAEHLAGKSLAQIAESKKIGKETLIATILDARTADLAGLVAAGKLTQTQMDLMVDHMETQIKTMVERTDVGPAAAQNQARPRMGQGMRMGRGVQR